VALLILNNYDNVIDWIFGLDCLTKNQGDKKLVPLYEAFFNSPNFTIWLNQFKTPSAPPSPLASTSSDEQKPQEPHLA
jgi:hypothetical protein